MNNKIIEILIQLLGHLKEHDLDTDSLTDFSEGLITHGYDEIDISDAITWFMEKLNAHTAKSAEILEQDNKSVRILHEFERINISTDVYGYLVKLKALSVITSSQMEKILDYYMLVGPNSFNESDINEIVANIIFEE